MNEKYHVVEGRYIDSILLMQISRELEKIDHINRASVMVATAENLSLLRMAGFHPPSGVSGDSIVMAVEAESDEAGQGAIERGIELMEKGLVQRDQSYRVDDVPGLIEKGDFPVLFVSVPGEYVFDLCDKALDQNLNLHIFSSNVPVEQEIRLKRKGLEKDLLVMGPDCGTSIIDGVGLGFANRLVNRGEIGIIGSSGTGIQELAVLLDRNDLGVSYAIGVGSNDLKKEVGGIMTRQAIKFLSARCSNLMVVCKNPDPEVEEDIIKMIGKDPSVFISLGKTKNGTMDNVFVTGIIDEGVDHMLKIKRMPVGKQSMPDHTVSTDSNRTLLKGYFVGGSLCYQAQAILHKVGIEVYSNAPVDKKFLVGNSFHDRNVCIDTGAEEYVKGRPHPMIDPAARNSLVVKESKRNDVRVILIDLILGYGSVEDPIAGLDEISAGPAVVASICGTQEDSQGYSVIKSKLESLGVTVFDSAASAAAYAAQLMEGVIK